MATIDGPVSPHLQIYKKQLTSVLSITHRATGILLSVGALLLAYWLMVIAAGADTYTSMSAQVNSWYGQLLQLAFVFSFYFHLFSGIRHLFWDAGMGLEIASAYRSGYAVIVLTVILTGITCYLAWFAS